MPELPKGVIATDCAPAVSEATVKLLHLSDLHFGATFDLSLWDYVGKVLAGADKPNIITVTGDLVDTPSFFMLALARNELRAMSAGWCSKGVNCELLVIPGNHDVGIWGNLATWPWNSKFGIVFADKYKALFDRLPTFTKYIVKPWYARWPQRIGWTLWFAFLRATFQLRRPPSGRLVTESAGRALCFASFDSNGKLILASGHINPADISQVHGELLQRRLPDRAGPLLNLVPRIALVHHHVIAIPYSSTIEGLTEFEPFLTLRNAGTLLRELCFWDFDLVLHGHKHLLNFVRLTFDSADQPPSEIAVLAAGSATKRQTISGQNSFNLIKVYRSGNITFRSVRYGQGTSGQVESPWSSGFQRLLPLPELKIRAHTRARAGQEICCDSIEIRYEVNESGSARCERQVRGLRGLNEEQVRRRRLEFSVSYGAIAAKSVKLNEESALAGHVLSDVPTLPTKDSNVQLVLTGQRLTADVGIDYGITWRLINSFATSHWECMAMGQEDARDWISTVVRLPCKRLKLVVQLPSTFKDPNPQVVVRRCHEYPLMNVNEQGDIVAGYEKPWEIDTDLTELEKPNVRMIGGRCEVDIEYPVVGHSYELRWRVDTSVAPTTAQRRGLALQVRRTLLSLAHPDKPKATELAALANEMLKKVTEQLIDPLIGSSYSLEEQLDCALFVYSDLGKSFELVAEGRSRNAGPMTVKGIPLNAGVSGAAFKHRGVNLYMCPSCAGSDEEGGYVYYPDEVVIKDRPYYAALLAIPLHLGDLEPVAGIQSVDQQKIPVAPEELIGIFTIATNAGDNKLLTLTGAPPYAPNDLQKHQLVTEIWTIAVQYLRGLGDAVRTAAQAG
jgi:3',5'-cyclic AMP phosphodiesterase CpdA